MASFTSSNYSHPVFPFVIPGKQLSSSIVPTLETQVTLVSQALENHTHASGYGAPVNTNFGTEVITPASTTGSSGLRVTPGVTPSSPVNGDLWTTNIGAYVRVNGATIPLVGGGAGGDVNLVSVSGSPIAIGQAAMVASLPVVLASNQSSIPVTGTFWQVTQPVSGTFWQATQPVSATQLPASLGQAAMVASLPVVLASNQTSIPVAATLQAGAAVIGHVIADSGSTTAVTGNVTVVQATPASLQSTVTPAGATTWDVSDRAARLVGKVYGTAGTAVYQTASTNNPIGVEILAGSAAIGTVSIAAAQTIAVTQATPASLQATVTPAGAATWDVSDRAARLLGQVYGSASVVIYQTASTNNPVGVEILAGSAAIGTVSIAAAQTIAVTQATPSSLQATVRPGNSVVWDVSDRSARVLGQTSITDLNDTSAFGDAMVRNHTILVTDDSAVQIIGLLLREMRVLNQAFQDWSGARPRFDTSIPLTA